MKTASEMMHALKQLATIALLFPLFVLGADDSHSGIPESIPDKLNPQPEAIEVDSAAPGQVSDPQETPGTELQPQPAETETAQPVAEPAETEAETVERQSVDLQPVELQADEQEAGSPVQAPQSKMLRPKQKTPTPPEPAPLPPAVKAPAPDEVPAPKIDLPESIELPDNWLDRSQLYVAKRGDALAQWFDGFFGDPSVDAENASSLIRMAVVYDYDQVEDNEIKLKVRGKVDLPQLGKRYSLVFSGEDSDGGSDDLNIAREDEDDDEVGLQYLLKDGKRSRFDLFGGIRGGFKTRIGVRYRFQDAPTKKYYYRFIEEVALDSSERLYSKTRLDFNYLLSKNHLLRQSNRVLYGQETDGKEWRSSIGWQNRLAEDRAITYSLGINGKTEPEKLVKSYGPAIRYRQNIFREYLFLELGSGYGWRKGEDDNSRKGAWSAEIGVEMYFESEANRRKRKQKKD